MSTVEKESPEKMDFDIRKDPYNHMNKLIFNRWKPFILRAMGFDEENLTHFSRFTKQLPISQKVLSQNLKEMEADGLVRRVVLPETPPRVEYHLTDSGRTLIPLLDAVYEWGWNDMQRKGLPVDALGEMWHGFRERDEAMMSAPYKQKK